MNEVLHGEGPIGAKYEKSLGASQGDISYFSHLWPNPVPVELRFDNYWRVYSTVDSRKTYRAVYGSWRALRGWQTFRFGFGKCRRLMSPLRWIPLPDFEAELPKDVVIIPLNVNRGIVIVSESARIALKLVYGALEGQRIRNEIRAWEMAEDSGTTNRFPPLISHGVTPQGGHWIATGLVCNTNPIATLLNPWQNSEKLWRRWLFSRVLPALEPFYEHSELEIISGIEWVRSLRPRCERHPSKDILLKLCEVAWDMRPSNEDDRAVHVVVHGDLMPHHIHRGNNSWRILDWGNSCRGCVSQEVLWSLPHWHQQDSRSMLFWAWLRREIEYDALPAAVREHMEILAQWQLRWQGIRMGPGSLRFHVLTSAIEILCRRWELSGRSLLSDDHMHRRWFSLLGIDETEVNGGTSTPAKQRERPSNCR